MANLQRLNPRTTALVVIDLQNSVVALNGAPYTTEEVVRNAARLDHVVTKHQWGAFYGTDLDLQLRWRPGEKWAIAAGHSSPRPIGPPAYSTTSRLGRGE